MPLHSKRDGDTVRVEHRAIACYSSAVDFCPVSSVGPHDEEYAAATGGCRSLLLTGRRRNGYPFGVEHNAVTRDPGAIQVRAVGAVAAEVLPGDE